MLLIHSNGLMLLAQVPDQNSSSLCDKMNLLSKSYSESSSLLCGKWVSRTQCSTLSNPIRGKSRYQLLQEWFWHLPFTDLTSIYVTFIGIHNTMTYDGLVFFLLSVKSEKKTLIIPIFSVNGGRVEAKHYG